MLQAQAKFKPQARRKKMESQTRERSPETPSVALDVVGGHTVTNEARLQPWVREARALERARKAAEKAQGK